MNTTHTKVSIYFISDEALLYLPEILINYIWLEKKNMTGI